MNLFENVLSLISLLNAADVILFCAVITLMILIILLIYVLRISKDEELPEVNVNDLTKEVKESSLINQTKSYKDEQEAKAIISYDELVNTKNIPIINYQKEEEIEGLTVKKIDLNNLANTTEPKPIAVHEVDAINTETERKSKLISYAKEEEFLATLKRLQRL